MLVLGRRDLEAGAVSVRVHGKGNLGARPREEVIADLINAAQTRRA
jgi:threonyl-tRNA synthetase